MPCSIPPLLSMPSIALTLPRYGLGNYSRSVRTSRQPLAEARIIADLSRAGKRLMGFCRTNLFKRLESSGQAFLQSIERHILRNFVYLHALENDHPLPIGTQDASLLDVRINDADRDLFAPEEDEDNGDHQEPDVPRLQPRPISAAALPRSMTQYAGPLKRRFRWLRADRFLPQLAKDLHADSTALLRGAAGNAVHWDPDRDAKLKTTGLRLITHEHPGKKAPCFHPVCRHRALPCRSSCRLVGSSRLAAVTGDTDDPTQLAWRFSPVSNNKRTRVVARSRTRRPHCYRCPERRSEPARCGDRREL